MELLASREWPGWSPQRTLVLPIAPETWPPPLAPIELDGIGFQPKDELHVTLVGRALGKQIFDTLGERFRDRAVRAAFEALRWRPERTGELLRLGRTVRTATGDSRRVGAIVELLQLPAMAQFHHALGDLLGRRLPVPPPHVTLYTWNREDGIGIPGPAKLRAWTVRRVHPRELAEAAPMVS